MPRGLRVYNKPVRVPLPRVEQKTHCIRAYVTCLRCAAVAVTLGPSCPCDAFSMQPRSTLFVSNVRRRTRTRPMRAYTKPPRLRPYFERNVSFSPTWWKSSVGRRENRIRASDQTSQKEKRTENGFLISVRYVQRPVPGHFEAYVYATFWCSIRCSDKKVLCISYVSFIHFTHYLYG